MKRFLSTTPATLAVFNGHFETGVTSFSPDVPCEEICALEDEERTEI